MRISIVSQQSYDKAFGRDLRAAQVLLLQPCHGAFLCIRGGGAIQVQTTLRRTGVDTSAFTCSAKAGAAQNAL